MLKIELKHDLQDGLHNKHKANQYEQNFYAWTAI
jgi:hypothetical protein